MSGDEVIAAPGPVSRQTIPAFDLAFLHDYDDEASVTVNTLKDPHGNGTKMFRVLLACDDSGFPVAINVGQYFKDPETIHNPECIPLDYKSMMDVNALLDYGIEIPVWSDFKSVEPKGLEGGLTDQSGYRFTISSDGLYLVYLAIFDTKEADVAQQHCAIRIFMFESESINRGNSNGPTLLASAAYVDIVAPLKL